MYSAAVVLRQHLENVDDFKSQKQNGRAVKARD